MTHVLPPRSRVSLDGVWDFITDPDRRLQAETLDNAGIFRRIHVPGPWQAQFDDLRDYTGVAWYRRTFELPRAALALTVPDPDFVIHFGAVDYFATIWLNGKLVGLHEGGYLPFEFTLNEMLRLTGSNELIVRVYDPGGESDSRSPFPFAEIPHGKQSWYGPIGGIWQGVYIEVRHGCHVDIVHVTPDVPGSRCHAAIELSRIPARPMGLVLTVQDPRGERTGHRFRVEPGQKRFEADLPIRNPLLWDTRNPHLYKLETALFEEAAEDVILDLTATTFGMRSIAASADGHFMLNGRILYIRGALDQDYYPDLIYTPFSDAQLDEQFAKARHMGLNCLRTHIKITDPRYYDAADRAGILIWTELPNWENLTEAVKVRARETLLGMVRRDWNHPSIIIWTIVNEGWGVDLAVNADHRAWLSETYDFLKELDPHRLVVGNSACFTTFHVVTDIEDFHNYYSIPDHYRQWRSWVESFAARPPWTFAHAYKDIDAWREFLRDPWNPLTRPPAPEVRRSGREPMVVSEFGNWGLPDVARLRHCYGGQDPWWFESGIEWGDGAVYPHGIEQRFKTWHLDKVFPTLSDLSAASQRMQFTALKYQIEQMRRHPSIVGYIITEFTDVHWECNGLLDMCRNPKAFHDAMAAINRADAVVPDWEEVSFWEGEPCEVRLALSHFSIHDLSGSRLEWHVDLWPDIRGVFTDLKPVKAGITAIGNVRFESPPLAESVRARLELRLLDAAGDLVTSNHLEIYFFPRRLGRAEPLRISAPPALEEALTGLGYTVTQDLKEADLAIVVNMTDDFRWYVETGGRVLWLAETPASKQTHLGSIDIAERFGRRWQGDWASNFNWIRQDQIFREIPTGGTVDFAFADLTPDHVITGLSPRDFAENVHAGLFVGWLHHAVALIAERRLGNGRLMISTFALQNHLNTHPVAAIMLRDMLVHLGQSALVEPFQEPVAP
jgi:hypothetical protein